SCAASEGRRIGDLGDSRQMKPVAAQLLSLALVGAMLASGGCHRSTNASANASNAAKPPFLNTGPLLSPTGPLLANQFTTTTPRVLVYDTADGKTISIAQDAAPDCHCAGRAWWVRTYQGGPGGQVEREAHVVIDQNGYIAESEVIDHADKVEV